MRWTAVPALVLAACAADVDGDESAGGACGQPFGVTLGEGAYGYEPRAEGTSFAVLHGLQPGYAFHVAIGGAVIGATGEMITVEGQISELTGGTVLGSTDVPAGAALFGYDPERCTGEFSDARILTDDVDVAGTEAAYQRFICGLEGDPIAIDVEITDTGSGASLSVSWTGTLAIDPSNDC